MMQWLQPDTVIPEPYNPQSWNRYSYVRGNPINFNDPTGHKECDYKCQIQYENADPEFEHYAEGLEWDVAEQRENEKIARTILEGGTELVASILFEPADWAFTAYHCANGDCSPWMLAGLLPVIPSSLGRHADDVVTTLYHSANPDAVTEIVTNGFRTDLPDVASAWHNNRFGRGVYLADTPVTALAERPGGRLLAVDVDLGKNLDVTHLGFVDPVMGQGIARGAREHGFDSITFLSARLPGSINTVIFDSSRIQNVSPVLWNNPVWNLFK